MKHIITSIALIIAAQTVIASNGADTLVRITDAARIVITESPAEMKVSIARAESDTLNTIISRPTDNSLVTQYQWNESTTHINIPRSSRSSRWNLCIGGPGLGWIDAVGQPAGAGIEMGKSLEVSWLNALCVKYALTRRSHLSIGLGFDWRNYRITTSQFRFIRTDGNRVKLDSYPEGSTALFSRLKVFSLGIPVLYQQSIRLRWLDGSNFNFALGAVVNFNTHGSLLSRWIEADGTAARQTGNHIGQRKVTIDLIAIAKIGWGLHAYARYSPQTVLNGAGNPEFRPLSAGLIFMY